MLGEFRDFIAKGNVLDLAVAVVMGAAFNMVVMALVADIITPAIGIPGNLNFTSLSYTVNNSTFKVGLFVNAVITFLSISIAVFFFIIKPVSKMRGPKKAAPVTTKQCPYCMSAIPLMATRCPNCTSKLKAERQV
ncbi:MAG: large conductance mechanosensitive channel protein MscL [Candidatus Micrarchaeota archaeon]|nr:large conductance mechanosensitive channel protein MscL [Candidatus Micrarchaeota archaeon]